MEATQGERGGCESTPASQNGLVWPKAIRFVPGIPTPLRQCRSDHRVPWLPPQAQCLARGLQFAPSAAQSHESHWRDRAAMSLCGCDRSRATRHTAAQPLPLSSARAGYPPRAALYGLSLENRRDRDRFRSPYGNAAARFPDHASCDQRTPTLRTASHAAPDYRYFGFPGAPPKELLAYLRRCSLFSLRPCSSSDSGVRCTMGKG